MSDLSRRGFLTGVGASFVGCGASPTTAVEAGARPPESAKAGAAAEAIARVEHEIGGRVGVFATDLRGRRTIAHRDGERFAMCSTFKWALAACVLARAEEAALPLASLIAVREADLLEYAPVTRPAVNTAMTVEALAEAAVTTSDNTAANLLLAAIGGPAELTAFLRKSGDEVTRLDRNEPTLNTNERGDARDTTTPRAMVETLASLLFGPRLAEESRDKLLLWMRNARTGLARLRGGVPSSWIGADKTGTGQNGACNDVATFELPGGGRVFVACYLSEGARPIEDLEDAHRRIAAAIAADLG